MIKLEGNVRKMKSDFKAPIEYSMILSEHILPLNDHIGSNIKLEWSGIIHCVKCGNKTNKSFFQGFCYPCFISAPESSECILKPELCQAHEGISRDMEWSEKYCLSNHYVYLSLTSGIKVGVTRYTQIPTRWIDQGAIKALKIAKTPNRYLAGAIEVKLKEFVSDRTSWQRMLKNDVNQDIDLYGYRETLKENLPSDLKTYVLNEEREKIIAYPINKYPEKIKSINFEKVKEFEGKLTGIKGQYIYIDNQFVVNMRKYSGFYFNIIIE
ncbi:MAG: hypothetical protein CMG11_05820 [Candidatus Marinimicrobia bacterium]|nr:hypothetical protein [Candidatus Neomarinimicrobiota bacterium]|tara:strand:- start:267 stop:1070 length:804 start_codon:yes stop_codon:yes gene_type:complete